MGPNSRSCLTEGRDVYFDPDAFADSGHNSGHANPDSSITVDVTLANGARARVTVYGAADTVDLVDLLDDKSSRWLACWDHRMEMADRDKGPQVFAMLRKDDIVSFANTRK